MHAADAFGDKSFSVNSLPPTVLYELASPSRSEEVRTEIVDRAERGEKLSPPMYASLREILYMPRPSDRRCRGNDILPDDGHPIEERHLVAGVRFMAHVVMTYGEVYAPIFDRLERELAEFRRTESATERARKFLLA